MLVAALSAENAPLLAQPFYEGGDPGPIAATMAHVPELLEVALPFIGMALGASSIDFRTKEIVIVRTSALLGCRYCIDSHTTVALDSGLSHQQVGLLRDEPTSSDVGSNDRSAFDAAFPSARDRALILWIDAVAGSIGAVSPRANDAVKASFADHEIVELTLLIGATMLLNRYATALQLPVGAATIERLIVEGFLDNTKTESEKFLTEVSA